MFYVNVIAPRFLSLVEIATILKNRAAMTLLTALYTKMQYVWVSADMIS